MKAASFLGRSLPIMQSCQSTCLRCGAKPELTYTLNAGDLCDVGF